MSNYTQSTNFATKDALSLGDPLKIVRGTEINTEFTNIAIAVATKLDTTALAAPGPIGATTPAAINGTTGNFSSTLSATDLTATIGIVTASGGKFTFAHTAPVVVTFSATAMVFNCALSNVFTVSMTANVTVAPTYTNPKDGQTINIFLTQDATGFRTITWGLSVKIAGGATQGVLSTAANSVDLAVLTYRSTTTFWYLTLAKAFA